MSSSSKGSTPPTPSGVIAVVNKLHEIRAALPPAEHALISQIDVIVTMTRDPVLVLREIHIASLLTVVKSMGADVDRRKPYHAGILEKLRNGCDKMITIINASRLPVSPVVPCQSASPVVPRQSAPPETYTHDDAVRCLNDANTAGDNDVYSNMRTLLARLRCQEKSTVFADIISAICTAAQDGYLYASCASLCDHYNTGQNCRECGITRLPNTDHHESWNDRLCPNCVAARHSGAAPIPVDRSPVARRLVSDYTGCPMCATGKHDGRHRICRKMPPICDGCLATAQLLAKELCPKPGSVFCIACHENHPYQPTR